MKLTITDAMLNAACDAFEATPGAKPEEHTVKALRNAIQAALDNLNLTDGCLSATPQR